MILQLLDSFNIIIIDNFNNFYNPAIKEMNWKMLKQFHSENVNSNSLKLIKVDILNINKLKIFDDLYPISMLIHLAAQPGVRQSIYQPNLYNIQNIDGTRQILDFAIAKNIKKVINFSSSAIYGNQKEYPLKENMIAKPISPYGISKLGGELLCEKYAKDFSLPIISLRPFSVYGPRQRPDMAINLFTQNILNKEKIKVFGDGSQIRDFTYIDDIITAVLKCISIHFNHKHHIFNLGCACPISINELIQKISSLLEIEPKVEYLNKEKGDVNETFASMEKAKNILNFVPIISIDEGLAKYIAWIKKKSY